MTTPSTRLVRVAKTVDEARVALTRTRGFEEPELAPRVQASIERMFGEPLSAPQVVSRILDAIRREGDKAVNHYSELIDGAAPDPIEVPSDEWQAAYDSIGEEVQTALQLSAAQIRAFHEKQLRTSWIDYTDEGALGQIVRPLERIGVYAPGGTAVYPSSLLMTAVPARVAGVKEIIVCSPPHQGRVSPLILAAALVAGVDRVFQIGGAQAIGAMAYGTETVPHVDKVLGPGNIFVVLAKQQVYGTAAIDQLPGPTETLLVADETADARLAAADMLAQAEHDPMASAILITTSERLAAEVESELERQLKTLERAEIARQSLSANGLIAIVPNVEVAVELANDYAPEHLCLLLANPWEAMPLVRNAGGVFIGENSPEALGDYTTGPSHVMPTGGAARFFSPIHLDDFTKVINVAAANRKALERLGPATIALARAEGLTAHARAIELRIDERA